MMEMKKQQALSHAPYIDVDFLNQTNVPSIASHIPQKRKVNAINLRAVREEDEEYREHKSLI